MTRIAYLDPVGGLAGRSLQMGEFLVGLFCHAVTFP